MDSHTVEITAFIVSHAPDQSPVITCMIALIIPKTRLIAVSTTCLMISQAVLMISFMFSHAA